MLRQTAENGKLPFFAADTHLDEYGHVAIVEAPVPFVLLDK